MASTCALKGLLYGSLGSMCVAYRLGVLGKLEKKNNSDDEILVPFDAFCWGNPTGQHEVKAKCNTTSIMAPYSYNSRGIRYLRYTSK